MSNVMTPDSKISNGVIEMDNTYLCHYGVKGQKWGIRKPPTQDSIRAKYSKIMNKSAKYSFKSDRYRYKAGRQTRFTDLGAAKIERFQRKSDKYYYRARKAENRGRKYIQRMEKKNPELFTTEFKALLTYESDVKAR